jgi:hypothetical protein
MKKIRKELEDVLKDIDTWSGPKERPSDHEIRRRELILWKQTILYKIEDTKINKAKKVEDFNIELLQAINSLLNSYYKEEVKT